MFLDKEFNKKLLSLILPISFQQFMLAVVSASDAVMLGMISQDKMAAVSLAVQVSFVENLFLAAMTIGLSMLAAQYWGKKDIASVEKIFAYVMKLTVAVSFVFFAMALFVPVELMKIFTNEQILIDSGAEYLRVVSLSYLLTGISQIYICVLKNSGRAKEASIISSTCMGLDMIMNVVLILGLFGFARLEIIGAAISTVIARGIEVVLCIVEIARKDIVKLRWKYLSQTDKVLRMDFWKYTTPVLGNEIVWGVGFTMYSVMMGHMGTDAVAANSIANIVKNLVASLCMGLGGGSGILIGNELGAGRLERAKKYGDRLCKMAFLCGVLCGILLLILIPVILMIVKLTDGAADYLRWMLVVCSYYLIGKSVNSTTIAGIFCAGGDSRFGFLCDAIVMWCIIVPFGMICAFVLKLPVVWVYFIISLDEFVKLPAVYRHYKKYNWVKDLTTKEDN